MYPTHRFRVAFDQLTQNSIHKGTKEYLQILHLAAMESESHVDEALKTLINQEYPISFETISTFFHTSKPEKELPEVNIEEVNLSVYDSLFQSQGETNEYA